jgi:hypothetical protein
MSVPTNWRTNDWKKHSKSKIVLLLIIIVYGFVIVCIVYRYYCLWFCYCVYCLSVLLSMVLLLCVLFISIIVYGFVIVCIVYQYYCLWFCYCVYCLSVLLFMVLFIGIIVSIVRFMVLLLCVYYHFRLFSSQSRLVFVHKSGSLRFSQFSGCWLILSVYIIMSFYFPFVRLFGVR